MEEKLENLLNYLNEQKKILNNSDSFDEIIETWKKIKETHQKCETKIADISKKIDQIDENINQEILEVSFQNAYKEMKDISEKIKTCNMEEIIPMIERIKILKNFCFKKLEQEQIEIEEIK